MSDSANVRSIDAIKHFRSVLATFAEDARNALGSSEMEVRRTRDWLARDQYTYWQAQIKRRSEQVSMARTDLHRRKLSAASSDAISDTEQKENLRFAENRLRDAEMMFDRIKKWVPRFDHSVAKYHSTSQPLGDRLTGSLVNSLALLERLVTTLESYIEIAPPSVAPAAMPTTGGATPAGPKPTAAAAVTSPAEDPAGAETSTEATATPAAGAEAEATPATATATAAPE